MITRVAEPVARVPDERQMAAWRAFLRAHARINRCLEAELIAAHGMSLASYDVLVQLAESPTRQLRMAELADAVLLSRSGVTRLVDRLEKAGLVLRERVVDDGSGVVATITAAGIDTLRTAARTHLPGVVRHFVEPLDAAELDRLGEVCDKLLGS
jgi:DNA-binding MarR family transcriptional regulator